MLEKYSIGIGDRFGRQARAQLEAVIDASKQKVALTPVWNKSQREHGIIGSKPADTRRAADSAVAALGFEGSYYVDADHISLSSVDRFLDACDFFTMDVADFIGRPAEEKDVENFVRRHSRYETELSFLPDADPERVTGEGMRAAARKYLQAVREAGRIYRHILKKKGGEIIFEMSMDETDAPQTPVDLFLILAMAHDEGIGLATIAPRFSGRFNKGVDYDGDTRIFFREFRADVAALSLAVKEFGLPVGLKLSIHSGSDKFSIYPCVRRVLGETNAGVHIKTAGTTWLEEVIGLALGDDAALGLVKEIYSRALDRYDGLVAPYASVLDIDRRKLPALETVRSWDGGRFADELRHDPENPSFNPDFRQFMHVSYGVAAKMGARFLDALERNEPVIAKNVRENIFERHIRRLFL